MEMSDLDSEQKPSRRLWIIAAAGALALHLGGAALAVAHLRSNDLDDSLGAPAIEIGLEMMSPHLEAVDLPPGPDTDASVASPALPEQQAELKETELPKEVPTDAEAPDRVVTPNDSKKPKEDDAKIAAVQSHASMESAAVVATATPSTEAIPEGPRSIAPAQGIGKSVQLAKVNWERKLVAHFKKHLVYPEGESVRRAEVILDLEFDRLGHVISANIAKGSGQRAFDEAALKMVRRSDPVPVPPPSVADEGLKRTLPIGFTK